MTWVTPTPGRESGGPDGVAGGGADDGRDGDEMRRAMGTGGRHGGHDPEGGDGFDSVESALADIAAGKAVVVVDDADRENEGDLIFAAAKATPELLAFMIRHTSGVICVPMLPEELDRLQIPLMTTQNQDRMRTAFTVSVDVRDGITTGISAADRARTIRALADSATEPHELVRPGHIFPLRYQDGGVLARRGHTEAAVDLARLAGLSEAGVLAEIVNDDGTMSRLPQLREFAREHRLKLISIAQLVEYRKRTERMVQRVTETRLPNEHGTWRVVGYASSLDGGEHLAMIYGDVGDGTDVLVRVHSECLTGDVLGSLRCDCGAQLQAAMAAIAAEGRGIVLYLRGHEGRGIGLLHKLRAYQLQDHGSDTVEANLELGLPVDAREYGNAAQMLLDLGVRSVRLLTNNPAKLRGMEGYGLEIVGRVPMVVAVNEHNRRYLTAKRDRLGHDISGLDARAPAAGPASPPGGGTAGAAAGEVPEPVGNAVSVEDAMEEPVADTVAEPVAACRERP